MTNQYRRMARTLVEYPFETSLIMDETLELGTVFGPGHQLAPVITALERYEKSIFEQFDSSSLQLRNVLRYQRPEHLAGIPDPAQSHPPGRDTYDALCGLIASFRLVEKWATWDKLVEAPETGSVPKQLNEELVVKYNPPYWVKLEGLQTMLRAARTTVASLASRPSTSVSPHIPPHLKHLRDLAIGDAKSSASAVIENFRVAAMHLSYILSLPAAQHEGHVLPDLPKEWSHFLTNMVGSNGPLTQAEQLSIRGFTESSEATTTKLRVVLHAALLVSPIYLLVPSSLRKCKKFSREGLFKVAAALGNQKPEALRMFEDEIWAVLRDVVLRNADLETALFQLVRSNAWSAMDELSPTDPSVTFFSRLGTTLVPMPARQMLPAPGASSTFFSPAINIPSRPMLSQSPLQPALPMPSRPIFPAPAASSNFFSRPIDIPSQPMLSGEPPLRPALSMPSRQILPAPVASSTLFSPALDIPSRPMFSGAAPLRPALPVPSRQILQAASSSTFSGSLVDSPSRPMLSAAASLWPPLPTPSRQILPAAASYTSSIDMLSRPLSSTPASVEPTYWSPFPISPPAPMPSHRSLSFSSAPRMLASPTPESLPESSLTSPTLGAANYEDPSSTPRSPAGTIPPTCGEEDITFKDLDGDDSDQSAPDYDGEEDTDGDHLMTGSGPSQIQATRTSARIEQIKLERLQAAAVKPASPEPAGWKKGKGRKRGKTIKSNEEVDSDEEAREAVKTGEKRARAYKDNGVARGKAGKRPRLDDGPDDGISEDEARDGSSADESGDDIMSWLEIERDLFVEPNPITLDIDVVPKKYTSAKEIRAYGPTERQPVVFTPVVQDSETLKTVESIAAAVQASYVNGLPLHLADPARSVIKIISEAEFLRTSDSTVQGILREKHIVVSEILHQETTFKEALRDAAPLNTRVDIQDQSKAVGAEADDRVLHGTLGMLVECSEKTDGKILNALDIPQPFESRERTQFASDIYALIATLNGMGWKPGMSLHNEDFRWAIAGLKGAFHGFHLDSDGLGTFLRALFGSKWWILASPKPGSNADFAKINTFLASNFNLDEVPEGWQLEAIVLAPGSKLIMRPNTPHAVFTIENSVFKGGHYNATSTIKDTFYGLIHGLVAGRYISNTDHGPSRFVLRQMLAFYHAALVLGKVERDEKAWAHVPDVLTVDGRIGLMTLCSFGILCNVLDFDTYRFPRQLRDERLSAKKMEKLVVHDYNAMSPRDRLHCTRTRALALDLVTWLEWKYEGLDWWRLFRRTVARHCAALYAYKAKAEAENIEGAPHCTLKAIKMQLGIFHPEASLQRAINRAIEDMLDKADTEDESLSIDDIWDTATISERDHDGSYKSPIDFKTGGISLRDSLYMKYTNPDLEVTWAKPEGIDNGGEDEGQEEGSDDNMDLSGLVD